MKMKNKRIKNTILNNLFDLSANVEYTPWRWRHL